MKSNWLCRRLTLIFLASAVVSSYAMAAQYSAPAATTVQKKASRTLIAPKTSMPGVKAPHTIPSQKNSIEIPRLFTVFKFLSIAAGGNHSCAISAEGKVSCWGENAYGQLGNESTQLSTKPVAVHNYLGPISSISLGTRHTCAVMTFSGENILCWGDNSHFQLGILERDLFSAIPTFVFWKINDDKPQYVQTKGIFAGGSHTFNLETYGLMAWGSWTSSANFALNDKTSPYYLFNTPRERINDAIAVAANHFQTCIVKVDGTVWCSKDIDGCAYIKDADLDLKQVMDNSGSPLADVIGITGGGQYSDDPQGYTYWKPKGLGGSTHIAFKDTDGTICANRDAEHFCAVKNSGEVWCWGDNSYGQLGNGTTQGLASIGGELSPKIATKVIGLANAIDVKAGNGHTCALTSDGAVLCWGDYSYGQLGVQNSSVTDHPIQVKDANGKALANITSIAARAMHNCAMQNYDTVICWGDNSFGQLGNGVLAGATAPVQVVFPK